MQKIILSIHGWELSPQQLQETVETLLSMGYKGMSVSEIITHQTSEKCFAITSDDGDLGDISIANVLDNFGIELCSFINTSTISERVLTLLKSKPNINIQDHGFDHQAIAISPVFKGISSNPLPIAGFSNSKLTPIIDRTGFLASPGFIFENSTADKWNEITKDISISEQEIIEKCLSAAILFKKNNKYQFKGKYENIREYKKRAFQYIHSSHDSFKNRVGKKPQYFAFTWWLGTSYCDILLKNKGYLGSFSNKGIYQSATSFAIPRLFIGTNDNIKIKMNSNYKTDYNFGTIEALKYSIKRLIH